MEQQFRCTQFHTIPWIFHFFLVRNYSTMPRNKMAHAKVIIARNSVQRIPIGNPNIYCSVYIPPKCICTALFIFLPSVYVLHCLHFSQVHVLCIVHIPLKCMYCIVYISPKSMCYVLFIYLPSAYVLHCLNFSQVHVLCIVYIPPSPCVLHCFFSSRNIWVAFFHFSHVYV